MIDLEDFEFAVVDRFPQAFSSKRPVNSATPRQLIDHLTSVAVAREAGATLTVRAFLRLRQLLSRQVGCALKSIGPRTRLADLMPFDERRSHWEVVRSSLALRQIPRLVRPTALAFIIALGVPGVTAMLFNPAASYWLFALVTLQGVDLALLATRPLARRFLPDDLTVGDLARYAVAYGSPILESRYPENCRSQIIEIVRALVRLEIGSRAMPLDTTWRELAEWT